MATILWLHLPWERGRALRLLEPLDAFSTLRIVKGPTERHALASDLSNRP